jgi:thiaminase (transcriptional activator TenA)
MRNPRRLMLTKKMLQDYDLSTTPPPPNSLFWKMWETCTDIAQEALRTDFIQGISKGILDPVKYGAFYVSDGYYCFNGAESYLAAECRAKDETLKMFLLQKYQGYIDYDKDLTKIWHLRDARGIVPIDVCKEYSNYEATITSHEDPIYSIPLMLPCEFIWYWLAKQLYPPSSSNLYAAWITMNSESPDSAYAMGNFLDKYQADHRGEIDESNAIQIYKQAMTYEYRNFAAATF